MAEFERRRVFFLFLRAVAFLAVWLIRRGGGKRGMGWPGVEAPWRGLAFGILNGREVFGNLVRRLAWAPGHSPEPPC